MWLPSDFRVQKLLFFIFLMIEVSTIQFFTSISTGNSRVSQIPIIPPHMAGMVLHYNSDASALFVQVFQNLFPAFHKTVTKALLGCFLLLLKTHMSRWGDKKHKTSDVETLFFPRKTWRHLSFIFLFFLIYKKISKDQLNKSYHLISNLIICNNFIFDILVYYFSTFEIWFIK